MFLRASSFFFIHEAMCNSKNKKKKPGKKDHWNNKPLFYQTEYKIYIKTLLVAV